MPPSGSLPSEQAAFSKHLFTQGYPLWSPDPVFLPADRQSAGLAIGDVGTVDELGRFDVFFNILEPLPGIPESFRLNCPPIVQNEIRCLDQDLLPREVVSSPETPWEVDQSLEVMMVAGMSRRTTPYSATLSNDGAHVILPQGAQLFDLQPQHRKLFENHAREHGAEWLEYYKDELGWPRSHSLYLLTGFYKTCSWSIASFGMRTAANADPVYVHCTLVEVDERTIQQESVWHPAGRFKRKIGPAPDRQGRNNQTVFIRGITITPKPSQTKEQHATTTVFNRVISRIPFLNTLTGFNEVTVPQNPGSGVIIQHLPPISQASHPSEIINWYLLKKEPSARIAVTHDRQWMSMLEILGKGQSWTLDDLESHLDPLVSAHYCIARDNSTVYLRDKEHQSNSVERSPLQNAMPLCDSESEERHQLVLSKALYTMVDTLGEGVLTPEMIAGWDPDVVETCTTTFESSGDEAARSNDPKRAITRYSAALFLNPPKPAGILVKRSTARGALGLWEDALKDADEAIKADSSNPWGHERRYVALHYLQRYDEAMSAFSCMHSLVESSSNPDVHQLAKIYVSPSKSETAIDNAVHGVSKTSPLVLIDVKSGRLCDGPERARIFKSEPEFKGLVCSMTQAPDDGRIQQVVEAFFQYVMLSHVWQGKEPLFQDVNRAGSVWELDSSPLNDKLRNFCEVVRTDGYRWAWSDTCCIDKTISTVLNQSLVMMYKWYEASAATFVLLEDVTSPSTRGGLKSSKWLSRAWTSQELLAPIVIRFYSRDWQPYLGDTQPNHKEVPEIMEELADAIGVARNIITAFNPDSLGVREKLRLASTRKATVDEDIAYSLIGMFKSDIRPEYGEGDAALGHLLEEIVARSGEVTVLAWNGTSSSYNSCLPVSLKVYSQPPGSLPPITDTDMDERVAGLRNTLSQTDVVPIRDQVTRLPPARFANRRLHLSCIIFTVRRLGIQSFSGLENHYRAKVSGIGDVEFRTSDRLPVAEPRKLIFVHPWIRELHDPHDGFTWGADDDDDESGTETQSGSATASPLHAVPTAVMDDYTRALRLVVRLQQPFHTLLLEQQPNGEFKRVATEHEIVIPGIKHPHTFSRDVRTGVVKVL